MATTGLSRFVVWGALLVFGASGWLRHAPDATAQTQPSAQAAARANPVRLPYPPLAPDMGEAIHWSIDEVRRAHDSANANFAKGQRSNTLDASLRWMISRTHAMAWIHRDPPAPGVKPFSEQHDGATDIYVVVGGSGRITVGERGSITDPQVVPTQLGEVRGSGIRNGRTFEVKAGDVLNVPAGMPHSQQAGPEGLSYAIIKVNVGHYPWSQITTAIDDSSTSTEAR